MKEILVSGDSFSSKSEIYFRGKYKEALEEIGLDVNNPFDFQGNDIRQYLPKYDCWVDLLNNEIKTPIKNLSRTGDCNFQICKKASDYIIKNYKNISFCIIALSEWTRLENGREAPQENLQISDSGELKLVIMKTLRYIHELQLLTKKFDIPCVIFNMLTPITKYKKSLANSTSRHAITNIISREIVRNPYFSHIDTKYVIGWPFISNLSGFNFWEEYFHYNQEKLCIGNTVNPNDMIKRIHSEKLMQNAKLHWDWHPNQEGHNLIYEKVIEQLKKFQLI